nr:actin binding protein IPP [Hymenolepis microstoma]
MQITPEIRHFDEDLLSKYANRFNIFRQELAFIDLSILTKGGTIVPAHKLVLCARFPGIKSSILNGGQSNFSNWSRFPHDIVMAVIDFAYTGEIIINAENVLGIYLMAHNLGCDKLINWTTDFIKTRLDRLNLMEVWLAGNATLNNDLIGVCIPRIACDFERLASSQRFFQHVGVEQFQLLLQSPWICDGNEATKFKALRTWFNDTSLTDEQVKREKNFHRLLELIKLNKLPKELVIETSMNESHFNLSENGRRTFLDKVLKLTGSAGKRTKTLIFVHVRRGDASRGALRAVPEISGERNSSFPFIMRPWSCTVALDGWVYTLGGRNDSNETISIVESINPLNGEVTELQPMIEERDGHSAVARDHAILVFGGYGIQGDNIMDSCEEFIPATNIWRKLPPMPTPRFRTGAAHIPGVGEIVVGGRTKTVDGEWVDVDNAEIYLTNSSPLGYAGSWCKIAPLLNSRAFPSAEFLNGKVYVAGDLKNSTSFVEMLSIFTEGPPQWTKLTDNSFWPSSMISFEGSLLFGTFDGKIYELQFNQDDENSSRQNYSWKLISELDHIDRLRLLKHSSRYCSIWYRSGSCYLPLMAACLWLRESRQSQKSFSSSPSFPSTMKEDPNGYASEISTILFAYEPLNRMSLKDCTLSKHSNCLTLPNDMVHPSHARNHEFDAHLFTPDELNGQQHWLHLANLEGGRRRASHQGDSIKRFFT